MIDNIYNGIQDNLLGNALVLTIDLDIYPLPIILRTLYWFTDKSYIFVKFSNGKENQVCVHFRPKENQNIKGMPDEFCNALLDQIVRDQVEKETHVVREIIVKKAFSEALNSIEIKESKIWNT